MSTAVAPARVQLHWSHWFHCESSFSLSLVPNEPGIFAMAEEVVEHDGAASKLTLNVSEVKATNDLFHSLNRLYSQDCLLREKLEKSRCFIRYAEVRDPAVRQAALADLQQWLSAPGEIDSSFVREFERAAGPNQGPYRAKSD